MIATKNMTTLNDPWEAYMDVEQFGKVTLSSIEFTTTHLCNMRCAHCAVGNTLTNKDAKALPIELLLQRLDEIPTLRTISLTGGEPMLSLKSVKGYVLPLLKYAHDRGVKTQINSNLTLDLDRYKLIAPYIDVLHISHNWTTEDEFIDTGFAMMERKPTREQRKALFDRIISNSKALTDMGVFMSAETMLNKNTLPYLEKIHKQVVEEMGCQRHEIHPMFPSDFASALTTLTLEETHHAIEQILDFRDENTWMLFGTLPFYPCSSNENSIKLLNRLKNTKNVSTRNDPDGRSRLNVSIFTGEVIVTDFGDAPKLGNIHTDTLPAIFDKWLTSPLSKSLNCHCPAVKCLGPNILVKNMYYKDDVFVSGSVK